MKIQVFSVISNGKVGEKECQGNRKKDLFIY